MPPPKKRQEVLDDCLFIDQKMDSALVTQWGQWGYRFCKKKQHTALKWDVKGSYPKICCEKLG